MISAYYVPCIFSFQFYFHLVLHHFHALRFIEAIYSLLHYCLIVFILLYACFWLWVSLRLESSEHSLTIVASSLSLRRWPVERSRRRAACRLLLAQKSLIFPSCLHLGSSLCPLLPLPFSLLVGRMHLLRQLRRMGTLYLLHHHHRYWVYGGKMS